MEGVGELQRKSLLTAEIRQAVEAVAWEGSVNTVVWQSGTGVQHTRPITTAFTCMCTSIVERCVIDAKAGESSKRTVLTVKHGGDVFSYFVGLAIRGGCMVVVVLM